MFPSLSLLLGALAAITSVLGQSVIVPGARWTDTSGNAIQAHGAGIFKVRTDVTCVAQTNMFVRSGIPSTGLGRTSHTTVLYSKRSLATRYDNVVIGLG